MTELRLITEAVLRIGEVSEVSGRNISISVDKDKNLSELFFDGDVLRNISVGSYIDIRKGFISLIGKVEGEKARFDSPHDQDQTQYPSSSRVLSVSLAGYIDRSGKFNGGTKELPLVGNEAYLITKDKVHQVHNLVAKDGLALDIALTDYEGYEISLPVDGLLNSHIAIFGNTGSGKSNTLALLYQNFIELMRSTNEATFNSMCRILLFDFNGEYAQENCLTSDKKIYRLSTYDDSGSKIPLDHDGFLDIEIISILADATEKTQKPFLNRTLRLFKKVYSDSTPNSYAKNILRGQVERILQMSDKIKADLLLDYLRQILPECDENGEVVEISDDLDWNNTLKEFIWNGSYLKSNPQNIPRTNAYKHIDRFAFENDVISDLVKFCYVQLIYDILSNRAQNEHIAPAINKLKSKQHSIRRIFDSSLQDEFFESNVVVVSLHDVNLEMKKSIPLLLAKKIYQDHKHNESNGTLHIVIDEAHNILSRDSFRESETWKDYRLETFEEIIKEGRKFGVFVTFASQRPSDIAPTITSQAHNYFIHRLINQRDLQSISNAVSYIDKITEESIPTLPTGTCIFSGVAGQMPLKLAVKPLNDNLRPKSSTINFKNLISDSFF